MEEASIGFALAVLFTAWFMRVLFRKHTDPGILTFNLSLMALAAMMSVVGIVCWLSTRS